MINRVFNQPSIPIQSQLTTQEDRALQKMRQESQFQKIFEDKLGQKELSFSAHAMARLEQRDIQLTSNDLTRLQDAVEQVAAKGGRDSLICMDNVSYVVNIPNRTVITAVDNTESAGLFTQIDSAMILT